MLKIQFYHLLKLVTLVFLFSTIPYDTILANTDISLRIGDSAIVKNSNEFIENLWNEMYGTNFKKESSIIFVKRTSHSEYWIFNFTDTRFPGKEYEREFISHSVILTNEKEINNISQLKSTSEFVLVGELIDENGEKKPIAGTMYQYEVSLSLHNEEELRLFKPTLVGKEIDALLTVANHVLLEVYNKQEFSNSESEKILLPQCLADAASLRDQRLELSEREHTNCLTIVEVAAVSGAIACATLKGPLLVACLAAVSGGVAAGINQCNINRESKNLEIQKSYDGDVETCKRTAVVKPINVQGSLVAVCSPSPWTEHRLSWQKGNQATVYLYNVWGKRLVAGGREEFSGSVPGDQTTTPLFVKRNSFSMRISACDNENNCTDRSNSEYTARSLCNQ